MDENTTEYTLSFADDQVVIAQNIEDMEYMSRKLIEEDWMSKLRKRSTCP